MNNNNNFNMKKVIRDKATGKENTPDDIINMIESYMTNTVSDTQMASWLMAAYINGLSEKEAHTLTTIMTNSGDRIEWPEEMKSGHLLVDKHSSGGVGDKTSLIVVPLIASLGIPVVKLSGRGLGHTGGTIDKLESIPGFNSVLPEREIRSQVKKIGAYIGAQSSELAPADAKLYALRNETATVENQALIASSILSKKFASGADSFVFDIKVGQGAFMKNINDATDLAILMRDLVKKENKTASFLLTNMDEPLGTAIGNILEVKEAISILKGNVRDGDLVELSISLAARMILNSNKYKNKSIDEIEELCRRQLASGDAYLKFDEIISAQGGDLEKIEFMESEFTFDFYSETSGIISNIDAEIFGDASKRLGSGEVNGKSIDPAAGIVLYKKVGDTIFGGERIAQLHYEIERANELYPVVTDLKNAIEISDQPAVRKPIILMEV